MRLTWIWVTTRKIGRHLSVRIKEFDWLRLIQRRNRQEKIYFVPLWLCQHKRVLILFIDCSAVSHISDVWHSDSILWLLNSCSVELRYRDSIFTAVSSWSTSSDDLPENILVASNSIVWVRIEIMPKTNTGSKISARPPTFISRRRESCVDAMSFSFSQALISETCPFTQPVGGDGHSQVLGAVHLLRNTNCASG